MNGNINRGAQWHPAAGGLQAHPCCTIGYVHGRNATGHCVQLPDDHVQACLCGWSLVVVVQ